MCGIAGLVSKTEMIDQARLECMISTLSHRGPNHAATRIEQQDGLSLGLGYCRLSIIDLSPAGNQPIANEAGDVWAVYNGELYNHVELRRALELNGHAYRSRTDTETVVHAYEEWGVDAFTRFNGMFACALYDQKSRSLILARDRRGIKPLYYFWDGSRLAFASELKALIKSGWLNPKIDPTALWLFLCLGYVPSPHCLVAGVRKLEPGHYLEWRDGDLRITPFVSRQDNSNKYYQGDVVHRVRESIEHAVHRQLMSDVPVGVFLSGGLDSTIVATLASRYHPEPLHTFAVGYARAQNGGEIDSRYNDDFFVARQIAARLGTIHHEVMIENNHTLTNLFAQLIFQLDEPMVEPVFMSTYYLAQLARECAVPVVLTGDGADELFGGYDRYFAAQRLAHYRKIPGLRSILPYIETMGGSAERTRSAQALKYLLEHRGAADSYIQFSSIYLPDQALDLLAPHLRAQVNTQALCQVVEDALGPSESFVDQMAQADLALWVGEHFNPRLDRISMTHSVEARVPFQDDEVVETALSIPMHRKSSRASRKGLLKRAFENVIPDLARTRPKRSYQAPGASWLQAGLNNIYRGLAEGEIDRTMLFHSEQVRQHMNTWGKGTPGKVFAVSALVIADLWARHYLSPNSE